MFSSRLRRRAIWSRLENSVLTDRTLALKEIDTDDFDISIGFVSITIIDEPTEQLETLRNRRTRSTDSSHLVIYFDERPNSCWSNELLKLQQDLLEEAIFIPVLPALSPVDLMNILETFVEQAPLQLPIPSQTLSAKPVVAQATAAAPQQTLPPKDVELILSLFGSIHGLEQATRDSAGRRKLVEHFGPRKARELIEFWDDEWVV